MDNVYVADGSVFATSGGSNPTLTIMAVALWIARGLTGQRTPLMTSLIATPDLIAAAATDVAGIGSTLEAAHAAAVAPTTGILAAAHDEVSTQIAAVFSRYAGEYQRLFRDAAAFHATFAEALDAAAAAYAGTESANAAATFSLGGLVVDVFDAVVYRPVYFVGQAWITSPVGRIRRRRTDQPDRPGC